MLSYNYIVMKIIYNKYDELRFVLDSGSSRLSPIKIDLGKNK